MTELGKIVKAQGVKGEVKVALSIDEGIDLANLSCVFIDNVSYSIISFRSNAGFAYILLSGIKDRNTAGLYVNKICYIPTDIIKYKKGTMLIKDVLNCTVKFENGKIVGTISQIVPNNASDIYYVATPNGMVVFPFIKKLLIKADLDLKEIIICEKVFKEVSFYEN